MQLRRLLGRQAVSLLAERVQDEPTALSIAGLLLPLTTTLDPVRLKR